jgi:hypothetical protein
MSGPAGCLLLVLVRLAVAVLMTIGIGYAVTVPKSREEAIVVTTLEVVTVAGWLVHRSPTRASQGATRWP